MTDNIKKPKDVTPKDVKVSKAKGRPMLTWVGKKPLARVRAYPAQAIERFDATAGQVLPLQEAGWIDWPKDLPKGGLLYHGDNKDVLAHLLANGFRGKVKLIYIDPPFDSGADYVRKVQLRGAKGTVKIGGEDYTLGEQVQYSDIWANDNYLQFMYERLLMLKELLSEDGSIVLHCNSKKGFLLRCLMEEVFSSNGYRNEITWHYVKYQMGQISQFVDNTDRLIWYSKGESWTYNLQAEKLDEPKYLLAKGWDKDRGVIVNLRNEEGKTYKVRIDEEKIDDFWSKLKGAEVEALDQDSKRIKIDSVQVDDAWLIPFIAAPSHERTGYPTQKPLLVLERVIKALSNPGDLVLDCFVGSGTTVVAAQSLGRRWIGCDINKGAIQTTGRRLHEQMRHQAKESTSPKQGQLISSDLASIQSCQLSFTTYRVNDYDLQIQHNEAVELACQHLGVTRTRTDAFFEGTQGGRLVKIVPFNHPLTPLDLEAVRNELKTRPTEERDVMVVCLGWQHDARTWVDTYNRNRPVNKLHVVELRTDRKLGGIIKHEPLSAQVSVQRTQKGDAAQLLVEVQDVVSPTIMQRLNMEQGVLRAQITDWRSVVDCILIDPEYDGQVFNVALADVPQRKQDLVGGRYELPARSAGSTLAVKIIDMLGEELVVTIAV